MLQPLVQKYPSAYYAYVGVDTHYVMFEGIRTRHATKDEALRICEETNARHGLPDVNVDKSSQYQPRKV
jgi:hypothetical protein